MLNSYVSATPTGKTLCPKCHGGRTAEKSFSVWLEPGVLKGQCFRASCRYYVKLLRRDGTLMIAANDDAGPTGPVLRPYKGDIKRLPPAEIEHIKRRYGFDPGEGIYWDGLSRYVLPIVSPEGTRRGVVLRRPHAGSTLEPIGGWGDAPKVDTYRERSEPMLSWYPWNVGDRSVVVLTEDQLSALKVRKMAEINACALLGTSLSQEKVSEIQKRHSRVILALDPDASSVSFAHARRWAGAFQQMRVLCLTRDIKDCESGEWLMNLRRVALSL